jgi:hypothetical protein
LALIQGINLSPERAKEMTVTVLTQMEVGMAPIKYANMINPISVINYLSYLPIVILTKFSRQIYEQKV